EKMVRHQQMMNHVTSNTSEFWAFKFIEELRKSNKIQDHANPTPLLDLIYLKNQFINSNKKLLLLDYDGTLTSIRKIPSAAIPSKELLDSLSILCSNESIIVFIISGRDETFLEKHLGHIPNLGLSAEHGCFIRFPNKSEWINLIDEIDLSWKNDVLPIFEYYTERTIGSFIEHKRASLTWHYRLADPNFGSWQAKECQNHLENAILSKLPVEILLGKKNLEVRPISINKGEIVKRLLAEYSDIDFIFCAGDDKTDEDMFKMLKKVENIPHPISCTIGSAKKMTQAAYHVLDSSDIINLLTDLANLSK
ncbi:hypothetical protein ROZALSC1DRAFT_13373, partial [Rozella allomycis CSF55]